MRRVDDCLLALFIGARVWFHMFSHECVSERPMPDQRHELNGVRICECAAEGTPFRTAKDATEQLSLSGVYATDMIAIPVTRLGDDFFRLETRIAGEVLQKFLQYRHRVAIVGDISQYLE